VFAPPERVLAPKAKRKKKGAKTGDGATTTASA
jgi:hypothetical protein